MKAMKVMKMMKAKWLSLMAFTLVTTGVLTGQQLAVAADLVVYKNPTCGCCKKWVHHLQNHGFSVEEHDLQDMSPVKTKLGVPRDLHSCHTARVSGYIIEGHVPAADIIRLLKERPQVKGLAVPGMPVGSPGMEGAYRTPYDVLTFQEDGKTAVYSRYNQ